MLAKGLGRCVVLITLEHSSDHLSSCGSCTPNPELQREKAVQGEVVSEGRGHTGPTDFHTHLVRTLRSATNFTYKEAFRYLFTSTASNAQ